MCTFPMLPQFNTLRMILLCFFHKITFFVDNKKKHFSEDLQYLFRKSEKKFL